jgi:hypothetical protein
MAHVLVPRGAIGVEPRAIVVLLQPAQEVEGNLQIERVG